MANERVTNYRVTFDVDYPDRRLNRVSTLLRPLWVAPVYVVMLTLGGNGLALINSFNPRQSSLVTAILLGGGYVFVPTALMIMFRKKYPRWWFDWNLELGRFVCRVSIFMSLMTDQYPSTEEHQSVHLAMPYPDVSNELNRWLPPFKIVLAIPHFMMMFLLWIGATIAVFAAWVAILISGRFPRFLFDYLVGVNRWTTRVWAYSTALATDKYPPFSLR